MGKPLRLEKDLLKHVIKHLLLLTEGMQGPQLPKTLNAPVEHFPEAYLLLVCRVAQDRRSHHPEAYLPAPEAHVAVFRNVRRAVCVIFRHILEISPQCAVYQSFNFTAARLPNLSKIKTAVNAAVCKF